ncbi:MAG: hypothetical protein DMF58_16715, partial [Acidobacteria bacterium]
MLDRLKRIAPFLKPVIVLALFAIALRVLQETLARYRYRDVVAYISSLPIDQVILAVVLTLLGYLVMTGYDTLAFEYIRHPLPYRKIALASFIGYAFNNNVGLSGLVGGSLRYRLYNAWRLSAVEIAKVIAFCTISFWLGFVLLGGTLFIASPPEVPTAVHLPFNSVRILGIILLIPAAAYFLWIAIRREPVRIRQWEFDLPTFGLFVAQVTISALDWVIAAGVLYILLPDSLPLTFTKFLSIFFLAQIAGVASNVPGGLGVFEAIILLFLAPFFSASAILGSLVAFRAIYYLLPLFVATILLATRETLEKREGVARAWRIFGRWAPGIAPNLLAFTGLVGGSLRYRLYNAWRLSAVEIAKVIAFCTISFWLGFVLLGGTLFIASPPEVPTAVHLPFNSVRILGIILLIPAAAYFLWIAIRREPVRIRQWEFDLPTFGLFVAQVTISALDWVIAAGVLYILLPDSLPLTFTKFLSIFFLAQIAGVASNVPGGLGVFEAIILLFLAPFFSASAILGSLVAFRAIYYLLPLFVATILLATRETLEKREGVARAWRIFGRWAPGIAPNLLAFTTF